MRRLSSFVRYAGASAVLVSAAACSILGSDEDSSGLDDGASATGGTAGSAASGGTGAVIVTGGTSGTGGTDSGGSGEGGGGTGQQPGQCESLEGLGPQCGATSKEATFKTINVMLVIDKSGSMTDQPEGFDTDKWTAMKDALGAALGDGEIDINFGMLLYPNDLIRPIALDTCAQDENCCAVPEGEPAVVVPITEGPVSAPAIRDLLDRTDPGGGTPTAAALQRAFLYFTEGEGADLEGENYVLLATDGGPNCNENASCDGSTCTTNLDQQCDTDNCCDGFPSFCLDDGGVTSEIEALANANVKTFVVGIPGTEAYTDYLNGFADAGGVPQEGADTTYYAVSAEAGVQGLVDVFNSITTQLVRSCDIELTEQPPKLDDVNVAIDCEIVERGENNENWDYDQLPNPTMIQLKGDVCTRLQDEGATRVDVVLGCPVVR
jgi:hypothetical protein